MSESRILGLLIPAVGGQGGGVLSEWIVDAAGIAGHLVHGTSIPGVAQRTGSTSYYVELFVGDAAEPPVFSLYPVPGEVDVLLAPELLEVGRMIELGFPSPSRTVIIASAHRLYSIHEKMATGRGIYDAGQLEGAARAFSRRLVAFDALAVAREHRTEANAVLLGALAGSGAAPISADAFRKAIESRGVAVAANLAGFELGRAIADGTATPRAVAVAVQPAPAVPGLFAVEVAALPGPVRAVVELAVPRLLDYQDAAYVRRYLERVRAFVAQPAVAALVARHLAVWMTYEDAIRVAQAKTRASRFARIRAEARADGAEIEVTDYLRPDLDEIWGILPHRLVAPFARWAERRWPHGRPPLAQHVRTTSVSGFLRLWLLARLRALRPVSWRAQQEQARMERWLAGVRRAAARDATLAAEVARLAQLVKGYGDVRRRLVSLFDAVLEVVLAAADAAPEDPRFAATLAARLRALVLEGPEGEARAETLAQTVRARVAAADVAGARAALAAAA